MNSPLSYFLPDFGETFSISASKTERNVNGSNLNSFETRVLIKWFDIDIP